MIEHISVRNWESLASADLELAQFTVVVGPSSSGKSALMRAFQAVASNTTGVDRITLGRKTSAISVRTGGYTVTLEYGRAVSDIKPAWFYRIVSPDGTEETYTKLNRSVPEAVTRALRITPTNGTSINFAAQDDPPFLLREPGAMVAKTLGVLTNADQIFEAARQAASRRKTAMSTLKVRQGDLERLRVKAAAFAGLSAQLRLAKEAEQLATPLSTLGSRIGRLEAVVEAMDTAQGILDRTAIHPEPPSTASLLAAQDRLDQYQALLKEWIAANNAQRTAEQTVTLWQQAEVEAHDALHATLLRAGQCPTCNRVIS